MGIRIERNCYVVNNGDILQVQTKPISTAAGVSNWIRFIHLTYRNCINEIFVGVDAQCKPNSDQIAVLSLNVDNRCLVFQILKSESIPPDFHHFLKDHRLRFVGVDILNTANRVFRDYNLSFSSALDLRYIEEVKMQAREMRYKTLEGLENVVLGLTVQKPWVGSRSWGLTVLSMEQIEFTTINAYTSSQIAIRLYTHNFVRHLSSAGVVYYQQYPN